MANEWRVCTFKVYKRIFLAVCRQRPYHVESTGSRPITEVKQRRARLVLGWVTAWEHRVLLATFFLFFFFFFLLSFLWYSDWFIWNSRRLFFSRYGCLSVSVSQSSFSSFFFFFFLLFLCSFFYPGGLVVKINHPSHSFIDLCPVSYREPQCLFFFFFLSPIFFFFLLSLSLFPIALI